MPRPVIEDLDGTQAVASRRVHVVVLSIVTLIATAVGWAAVSSPELRGPYATPRPIAAVARFTPAPLDSMDPAAAHVFSLGCTVPGASNTQWVFTGGQSVAFVVPQRITVLGGAPTCAPAPRPPFER